MWELWKLRWNGRLGINIMVLGFFLVVAWTQEITDGVTFFLTSGAFVFVANVFWEIGYAHGSELKRTPEWDEGLQSYRRKNKLIAELAEFLLNIDTNTILKARRGELLHRAAIELDPDAFWIAGKLRLLINREPDPQPHGRGRVLIPAQEGVPPRIVTEESAANLRSVLDSAIAEWKADKVT